MSHTLFARGSHRSLVISFSPGGFRWGERLPHRLSPESVGKPWILPLESEPGHPIVAHPRVVVGSGNPIFHAANQSCGRQLIMKLYGDSAELYDTRVEAARDTMPTTRVWTCCSSLLMVPSQLCEASTAWIAVYSMIWYGFWRLTPSIQVASAEVIRKEGSE